MKKKKVVEKKKNLRSKPKNPEKSRNFEQDLRPRLYPELDERQELAIVKICEGKQLSEIADEIGVRVSTLYDWKYRNESFYNSLKKEWERIISESRDIHSEMIRLATDNVFKEIKKGDPHFSYQFLSDSGFLPSSMNKDEKERLAQELAEKLINVANQG